MFRLPVVFMRIEIYWPLQTIGIAVLFTGYRRKTAIVFFLKHILQIGLDQVVLQQDFQSLGKTFWCVAVYFTYVFEGV